MEAMDLWLYSLSLITRECVNHTDAGLLRESNTCRVHENGFHVRRVPVVKVYNNQV